MSSVTAVWSSSVIGEQLSKGHQSIAPFTGKSLDQLKVNQGSRRSKTRRFAFLKSQSFRS